MAHEHKGEAVGTREIRKHLLQYLKGIHNAKAFRSQLVHVKNLADVKAVCETICEHDRSYLAR